MGSLRERMKEIGKTVCPHCSKESVLNRSAHAHTCTSCGRVVTELSAQLVPITVESQVDEPLLVVTSDMRGASDGAEDDDLAPPKGSGFISIFSQISVTEAALQSCHDNLQLLTPVDGICWRGVAILLHTLRARKEPVQPSIEEVAQELRVEDPQVVQVQVEPLMTMLREKQPESTVQHVAAPSGALQ